MLSAYHWDKWSNNLFKPYIQKMCKLKIEASGWPDEILSSSSSSLSSADGIEETVEIKKARYLTRNGLEYGILLDPTQIEINAGKRHVAKIAANCFWGNYFIFK